MITVDLWAGGEEQSYSAAAANGYARRVRKVRIQQFPSGSVQTSDTLLASAQTAGRVRRRAFLTLVGGVATWPESEKRKYSRQLAQNDQESNMAGRKISLLIVDVVVLLFDGARAQQPAQSTAANPATVAIDDKSIG